MPRLSFYYVISFALLLLGCYGLSSENQRQHGQDSLDKQHPRSDDAVTSSRAKFDQIFQDWGDKHPNLRGQLSPELVEKMWAQVHPRNPKRDTGDFDIQTRSSNATGGSHKPLTSDEDIAAAERLVASAQHKISRISQELTEDPRRNEYVLSNKTKRSTHVGSVHVSEDVRHAAAALAEIDAAKMKKDGTLYKTYDVPVKRRNENAWDMTSVQAHSGDVKKRDGSGWWLPQKVAENRGGSQPLGGDSDYKVWRNVKDYGAKGDGLADDTEAINNAIADGNRCGSGCSSSSVTGATVYFPPGVYLVSSPIIALYNTQLVGDATDRPVIYSSRDFTGLGVISSDVYYQNGNGASWYLNTGNFYRQIRNFVVDVSLSEQDAVKGIHWQVAQACSLQNIHLKMKAGSTQIGVFMENGSGGFMSDITFSGGASGLLCGNQQFTARSLYFFGCTNAISMLWDWGWTWHGIWIQDAKVGINYKTDSFGGGSLTLLDSIFFSVETGIITDLNPVNDHQMAIMLRNVHYMDVSVVVDSRDAGAIYHGTGTGLTHSWVLGNIRDSDQDSSKWKNGGYVPRVPLSPGLINPVGSEDRQDIFVRTKPQYEDSDPDTWIFGDLKADGETDETAYLSGLLAIAAAWGSGKVLLPAGTIIVSDTIDVPPGVFVSGICWTQIMATGDKFMDEYNPHPMVRVGEPGDEGDVELQDLLFTARGPTSGLVAVEWNIKAASPGSAAMWDCHVRIGGAKGTDLQLANCPKLYGVQDHCKAGSLLIHLTTSASAYLENVWAWVADHDLDSDAGEADGAQIDIFVGRGILIESTEPTWMFGTASEHCVLYQYGLVHASKVFMGMIQTESPYYLPDPVAPDPFRGVRPFPRDPTFGTCDNNKCRAAWGLYIVASNEIFVGGAGLYSWFYDQYSQSCLETRDCQESMVYIDEPSTLLDLMNVITIGSKNMIVSRGGEKPTLAEDNAELVNTKPWSSILANYQRTKSPFAWLGGTIKDEDFDLSNVQDCMNRDSCLSRFGDDTPQDATSDLGYLCVLEWLRDEWVDFNRKSSDKASFIQIALRRLDHAETNCEHYDQDKGCTPDVFDNCEGTLDPAFHWAGVALTGYHAQVITTYKHNAKWQDFPTIGWIDDIADALSLDAEDDNALQRCFDVIGQILGLASTGLGLSGVPVTAQKVGSYLGGIGSAFSTASGWLPTNDPEKVTKQVKDAMETALRSYFMALEASSQDTVRDVFVDCDIHDWPEFLFPDDHHNTNHSLTWFLSDQRYLTHLSLDEIIQVDHAARDGTLLGLLNFALLSQKYYILRDPLGREDCEGEDNPSVRYFDGHCYVLAKPGGGSEIVGTSGWVDGDWNNKLSSDAGKKIEEVLQGASLSLKMLMQYAVGCQDSRDDYFDYDKTGSTLDVQKSSAKSIGSSCIVNLPVLHVEAPNSPYFSNVDSPCKIQSRDGDGEIGYNYLPKYLDNIFTDDFCHNEPGTGQGGGGCRNGICHLTLVNGTTVTAGSESLPRTTLQTTTSGRAPASTVT